MKKLLLSLSLVIVINASCAGQGMPVYDNTNFISLVKSLVESAKQTSQLLKTVEFLKQQKENLEKVNAVVKQLKAVKQIGQNNQRLIQVMQNDLKEILNSPYITPQEVTRVTESFNAIVDHSLETMAFIDEILSSGYLKMSDGERTEILQEKEMQSREMLVEIQMKTQRYRDIISFRKMQNKINNRNSNF